MNVLFGFYFTIGKYLNHIKLMEQE